MHATTNRLHRNADIVGASARKAVIEAARNCAASKRALIANVVDLDQSGEWALDGSSTCAHWLGKALDTEPSTVREWLRVGRSLHELPHLSAAFYAGDISYAKVRVLTRVATPLTDRALCELGQSTSAANLKREVAVFLQSTETPEETEHRHHHARSCAWRVEHDGMVTITVRLPPVAAAALINTIDAIVLRLAGERTGGDDTERGIDASADASIPRHAREWSSLAQQRADALTRLCSSDGASTTTEIVLHVRGDGCTLDDGTPVAESLIERIAPESFLRVLIHDAAGRPIDASSRRRRPTARQKRVVRERDRVCIDCESSDLLEYDHVPSFHESGRTVVDELVLRCAPCHHRRHQAEGP